MASANSAVHLQVCPIAGTNSEPLIIDRFVELTCPAADILVTLGFADGSSTTIGIA